MMEIPMVDLVKQYNLIKEKVEGVVKNLLSSGRYILGPNLSMLEEKISNYCGSQFGVGVASGTDAIHLALRACGVKMGDEVITTPFTFIASVEAISYIGAVPVFADIEYDTFNVDPSCIEEQINPRTKAILVVHLFGQSANIGPILEIADAYHLKVIEDCAQSFGALYQGKHVGAFGDAGCFSFFPSKNLGCFGDGGMIIVNDEEYYDRLRLLRNHGAKSRHEHEVIGYNSRLDEIQAAVLLVKLGYIDEWIKLRRDIANHYTSRLSHFLHVPLESENCYHTFNQYTVRIEERRDQLRSFLRGKGISTAIHYPKPIHLQNAFSYLGYKKGDYPVAEAVSNEVLSLPIYPELECEKIDFICDAIADFLG